MTENVPADAYDVGRMVSAFLVYARTLSFFAVMLAPLNAHTGCGVFMVYAFTDGV